MSEVLLELKDHVAIVTLNAPERRNAMTAEMNREISAFIDEIDNNLEIGAAVITGAGDSFCAGADRRVLEGRGRVPVPQGPDDPNDGYRAFMRVGEAKVPTVAAIRGYAVGAGCNLAYATDLRIVA